MTCEPDCEVCGGAGHYRLELPRTHEDFGRVFTCSNLQKNNMRKNASIYGLAPEELDLGWDAIKPWNDAQKGVEAVQRALERGCGWVYLWGDDPENPDGYGIGKSLMLQVATAVTLREGKVAVYRKMQTILNQMKEAFDEDNPNFELRSRLDWFSKVDVLCLDEFNRITGTDWEKTRKMEILDYRYQEAIRENSSVTIMAANMNPAKLEGYLWSRIQDGRFEVVKMSGVDMRPAMEYNK